MLLKNLGDGAFADVAMAVGADNIKDARSAAISDFDQDGDLDMIINHNPGIRENIAPVFYRNDIGARKNWLAVELTGVTVNRDAAGSEVHLEFADGTKQMRHVKLGSGYASQSSRRLHFGLGDRDEIAKLTVVWKGPDGGSEVFENIDANQAIAIEQGSEKIETLITNTP